MNVKYSFIGGDNNWARGDKSFVGGGSMNQANGTHSFVGGGCDNIVDGNCSSILGGYKNYAQGDCSVILGGTGNNDGGQPYVVIYGNGITATNPNTMYMENIIASGNDASFAAINIFMGNLPTTGGGASGTLYIGPGNVIMIN